MSRIRQLYDWLYAPILMVVLAILVGGGIGVWLIVGLVCIVHVIVMLVRTRRNRE